MSRSYAIHNQITLTMCKYIILIFCLSLSSGCSSKYEKIEIYYNANKQLHQEITDSLKAFCKRNRANVIVRKNGNELISFLLSGKEYNYNFPVLFDAQLLRHDMYTQTSSIIVPPNCIENFKKTTYKALLADSNSTFFSINENTVWAIGPDGEAKLGILISNNPSEISKGLKQLSSNACIANMLVP